MSRRAENEKKPAAAAVATRRNAVNVDSFPDTRNARVRDVNGSAIESKSYATVELDVVTARVRPTTIPNTISL